MREAKSGSSLVNSVGWGSIWEQPHSFMALCLWGRGNGDCLKQPEGVTAFNEKPTSSPQASHSPWHPWEIRLTARMFMDTGHGDFPIRQTFIPTALLVLLLIILLRTGAGHHWHCCFAWQSSTISTSRRSSVYSGRDGFAASLPKNLTLINFLEQTERSESLELLQRAETRAWGTPGTAIDSEQCHMVLNLPSGLRAAMDHLVL